MEKIADGSITFQQLGQFGMFIIALVVVYNTIMTAVKNHREEKSRRDRPMDALEIMVKDHEVKLKRDHERLNYLEEAIRILMRSNMAQLSHDINGNSDDKLNASLDEIQKFLIAK